MNITITYEGDRNSACVWGVQDSKHGYYVRNPPRYSLYRSYKGDDWHGELKEIKKKASLKYVCYNTLGLGTFRMR